MKKITYVHRPGKLVTRVPESKEKDRIFNLSLASDFKEARLLEPPLYLELCWKFRGGTKKDPQFEEFIV